MRSTTKYLLIFALMGASFAISRVDTIDKNLVSAMYLYQDDTPG